MKTIALSVLIFFSVTSNSQSVSAYAINAAGNSYSQGRYEIEWSIGELALVNSMQSTGNEIIVVTNGLLQPALANNNGEAIRRFTADEIKILPNPTNNKVEINFATQQKGTLYVAVFDVSGKPLQNSKLVGNGILVSRPLDLTPFASGTYFLKIDLDPLPGSIRKTGSYKIVKL